MALSNCRQITSDFFKEEKEKRGKRRRRRTTKMIVDGRRARWCCSQSVQADAAASDAARTVGRTAS